MTHIDPDTDTQRWPDVHRPVSRPFLRHLGALEELYWYYGRATPFHFALAAEIEGETEVRDWRRALDLLQHRHPLFSASVDQRGWSVPRFVGLTSVQIPLRVVEGTAARWEDEMAKELSAPFDNPEVPLVRAVVLWQREKSAVILVCDHSIADGLSLANAFQDILEAIADNSLDELELTPPFEELAGAPKRASKQDTDTSEGHIADLTDLPLRSAGFIPKISSLRLTPDQTRKLADSARVNGTTLHGILCAALILAGRAECESWNEKPIRILSPMNLRGLVGLEKQSVLAVGVAGLQAHPDGPSTLWELARYLKEQLSVSQSPQSLADSGAAIAEFASKGLDARKAAEFMLSNFTSDGMVTNLGKLSLSTTVGSLKMTSLWGPAILTGVGGEQVIGVSTLNGSLCLLHTSPEPFDGLLPRIAALISNECERLSV